MQFNGQYTVATTDTVKGKLEYGINNYLSMLFRSLTNVCVPLRALHSLAKNTKVLRAKTRMLLFGTQKCLRGNTKHLLE